MHAALAETGGDMRPVFDSEHGPIPSFHDRHRTLAEAFGDEYGGELAIDCGAIATDVAVAITASERL
jgi:hypothetical protein